MVKKWTADRPHDTMHKLTAYAQSGFSTRECILAEGKVAEILRSIHEVRVTAEQVLIALLPLLRSRTLEILEHDVRAATQKVLDED